MIRLATLAAGTALALVASAASAQSMQGMRGMNMPMPAKKPPANARPAAKKAKPTPSRRAARRAAKPAGPGGMPGMDMGTPSKSGMPTPMPGMDMGSASKPESATPQSMPGMDMSGEKPSGGMSGMPMSGAAMPGMAQSGTALPAGDAPAPPAPGDHYADRFFPAPEMAGARRDMMREQGGRPLGTVLFNLAEYQVRNGRDGYRWDGEGWFGGDINRLTVKTEGEGTFREGVDGAEIQALYSRAVGPYFNLQAGVRHDFKPSPTRTYATMGFEGLAPYMFEVEGAAFISPQGDVLGRLEGYYDQRITQRLILQPRVEINLSAQDMPRQRIGSGLTDAELGLRLRYEVTRRFAPYVGVSYEAKTGRTADYSRADGERPTSTSLVAGLRFGF